MKYKSLFTWETWDGTIDTFKTYLTKYPET